MAVRKGWTTEGTVDSGCAHQWRKEFKGDGINWGFNTRYRKCAKCHAYQRYVVPEPRRKPEPYPPCRQVDYGKIAREVGELLRKNNYRTVPVIVVIAGEPARRVKA